LKKDNDDCPDIGTNIGHKWCPLGYFCNSAKKCVKQVSEGQP